jgi:hypothetical protein
MKKIAEEKKVVVAQAKADCEELLVEIVQDKRVADEQEKQVRRREGRGHRGSTAEGPTWEVLNAGVRVAEISGGAEGAAAPRG